MLPAFHNQKCYNVHPYLLLLEHLHGSFSSIDNRNEISGCRAWASITSPDSPLALESSSTNLCPGPGPVLKRGLSLCHAIFISELPVPT